ncbi:hypothetical protein [Nocardioides sp.]|uniref:hypothetical protein n=1 Tax=Nocardioides sp. TaxID=35761 RepID=UPI003782D363
MSNRTPAQTLLLVVGVLLLLAGLACVVVGFAGFANADPGMDDNTPIFLFAGGGLAAVVGFGIIAFTRASILMGDGGYTRITVEHGRRPDEPPAGPSVD